MKAVVYETFEAQPKIMTVPDPSPDDYGVIVKVMVTGLCRSDWHGWKGFDPDIELPHVPGHELAGTIEAVGKNVQRWKVGDRVTVPFVGGCGGCHQCHSGNHQVCDRQFQPGFTHWGSFADYVSIHYADVNLVRLPDSIEYVTAATLGCRFATAWRAVVDQGRVAPGQWVAVHGCGGVGLSAVMIATALGAHVIAVDISEKALALASDLGAVAGVNAVTSQNIAEDVKTLSGGGAHISMDAVGNGEVCYVSIHSLRKRGRHIQVGLLDAEESNPNLPLARVISHELEILGSHGMQAWRYPEMIDMILSDRLQPQKLVKHQLNLEQSIGALVSMGASKHIGVTVINLQ